MLLTSSINKMMSELDGVNRGTRTAYGEQATIRQMMRRHTENYNNVHKELLRNNFTIPEENGQAATRYAQIWGCL